MSDDLDKLPLISYYHKVNCLVNTESEYSMEEPHGLKSMDAYNQYLNKFVKDVPTLHVNKKVLVTGRVKTCTNINISYISILACR